LSILGLAGGTSRMQAFNHAKSDHAKGDGQFEIAG
jgi:hypothetical protein